MQPEIDTNLKSFDLQTLTNLFDGEFYLPTEPLDPALPIQFQGKIEKGILMLIAQKLDAADTDQLQKICNFLKIEFKDVAVANVNEQTITKEKLIALKPKQLVCWGVNPTNYFTCSGDIYTPIEVDGLKIIYSASLPEISADSASKKMLASALLLIFN